MRGLAAADLSASEMTAAMAVHVGPSVGRRRAARGAAGRL